MTGKTKQARVHLFFILFYFSTFLSPVHLFHVSKGRAGSPPMAPGAPASSQPRPMATAWRDAPRGLPDSRVDSPAPWSGRPMERDGRWDGVPLTTPGRLPGTPPFPRKGRSSLPLAPTAPPPTLARQSSLPLPPVFGSRDTPTFTRARLHAVGDRHETTPSGSGITNSLVDGAAPAAALLVMPPRLPRFRCCYRFLHSVSPLLS